MIITGPKLYKEPSAKSNKHIIQNALAHCCLAGKVNEGQKKKILEVSVFLWKLNLESQNFKGILDQCQGLLVGTGISAA